MGTSAFLLLIFLATGIIILLTSWFGRPKRLDLDEGVDVENEANDAELTGPVTITRQCLYPGSRQAESGQAIARYETGRVTKWILSSGRSYTTQRGHYVLYEYFCEDGTLEHDRLVFPEPGLGGGVYVKVRLRYFNTQKELIEERYFRDDGTLGLISGAKRFQQFRHDGKTLRFEQLMVSDSRYRSICYKLDGTTVWMEIDADGNTHVSFDLTGNPVDLNFTRENAIGSYGMGPQSQPLLTSYDRYTRKDGTLSYKQTWYARWDNAAGGSVDTLGAVVLYDAAGINPVAECTLDLGSASMPRFIKQMVLHNADGTKLVRKYRSPNCRLSEDTIDQQGKVMGHKDFTATDHFQEAVDDIVFQGFTRNVWGFYDDESHDI